MKRRNSALDLRVVDEFPEDSQARAPDHVRLDDDRHADAERVAALLFGELLIVIRIGVAVSVVLVDVG